MHKRTKHEKMKVFIFLFVLLVYCSAILRGQAISGSWYGRAEANTNQTYNTYLCAFDFKKKGTLITGDLHYFFGALRLHTPVTGKYWPATNTIELNPFPLITYFSRQQSDPDCIMDGSLTLYINGTDTVLYGQLNPVSKYRLGCPVMTISLKKEGKEQEPEGIGDSNVAVIKLPNPVPDTLTGSGVSVAALKDTGRVLINNPDESFLKRAFLPGYLIEVSSDEVDMYLYDNAEFDRDTVSIFLNRQRIADKLLLSAQARQVKLKLTKDDNELAVFAENLGQIPPNTAICIIQDGENRFTIHVTSTFSENGTIRIRKKVVD